ncbi:hypothetical protein SDC9_196471 [bioreactor metagenome]|uniref:Uncharacterized protein n=1 Tax=bioreactor metagenome TaxID=1076179 RepID=A0A645IEH9_9ZZZZ
MFYVFIGELVQIIEKNDRRCPRYCLGKHRLNRIDELSIGLIFATNEHCSTAGTGQAIGHESFAHSRFPMQKQTLGQLHPKFVVRSAVF